MRRSPGLLAVRFGMALAASGVVAGSAWGQASGTLGNGLSAAAIARGGTTAAERGDPLDAVEGNPAGIAGIDARVLDASCVVAFEAGSFRNAANANGRLSGLAGALPYGAFAMPLGRGWSGLVGFTPEIALRANWRYVDAPGTAWSDVWLAGAGDADHCGPGVGGGGADARGALGGRGYGWVGLQTPTICMHRISFRNSRSWRG